MDINALKVPMSNLYEDLRMEEFRLRRRKRKRPSGVTVDGQMASSLSAADIPGGEKEGDAQGTLSVIPEERCVEVADSPRLVEAIIVVDAEVSTDSPSKRICFLELSAVEEKGKSGITTNPDEQAENLLGEQHSMPSDLDLFLRIGNPLAEKASTSRPPGTAEEERVSPKNIDLSIQQDTMGGGNDSHSSARISDFLRSADHQETSLFLNVDTCFLNPIAPVISRDPDLGIPPTRYTEDLELMKKNMDNFANTQFCLRSEMEKMKAQMKNSYETRMENMESQLMSIRSQMDGKKRYFEDSMCDQFKMGGARVLMRLFEMKSVARDVLDDPVITNICKGVFVELPDL